MAFPSVATAHKKTSPNLPKGEEPHLAGVTQGSVTSYISAYVAGVTQGSVTSYISAYVAGVTLGSVTSYISTEGKGGLQIPDSMQPNYKFG